MVRYIIGIDYGHGETSAAFVDLEAVGTPVEDLTITGNHKKIRSMMATFADGETDNFDHIDPNDWALSPDWTTLKYTLSPDHLERAIPPFAAYFKGPVSNGRDGQNNVIDGITKQMFGIFCKKIYDEIIENNRFLTPAVYDQSGNIVVESNFVLYVACPSGWEDNEQLGLRQISAYKEFLIQNGVPCQDIVQESRAAYVTARDTFLRGLSYQETPGVLIVDYGSSTIDLTWFGNKPAFTDGYELGARNVEEILFDYLLQNEEPAQIAYNNYSNQVGPLVAKMISKYGMRLQKEAFFDLLTSNNIPERAKRLAAVNLAEVTPSDNVDASDSGFRFASSRPLHRDDVMLILETHKVTNASLNNETYIGAVMDKLRAFKDNPKVGDIDYVVLTGGATKMSFVQDLIKSIYNIDDNHLIVDNIAPSFAISRGVATYGVKKYYSDPILNQIEETFNNTWGNDEWIRPKLESWLSEMTKQKYNEKMSQILSKWTDGDIVADTTHNLQSQLNEIIEEEESKGTLICPWNEVKDSIPIVNGAHSIHALFTSLIDLIEDEISVDSINYEIETSITIEAFETEEDTTLIGLLRQYIEVYFPNGIGETELIPSILIPNTISVSFDHATKQQFIKELVKNGFTYVTSYGWGWSNEQTLNRDRYMDGGLASPGRRDLNVPLQKVIDEFAKSITSRYDLNECIDCCHEQIRTLLEEIKAKCELSTYTLI